MEKKEYTDADLKTVTYKDVDVLRQFVNPNGRILSQKRSGLSAKRQRQIARAIKNARYMALLPYVDR